MWSLLVMSPRSKLLYTFVQNQGMYNRLTAFCTTNELPHTPLNTISRVGECGRSKKPDSTLKWILGPCSIVAEMSNLRIRAPVCIELLLLIELVKLPVCISCERWTSFRRIFCLRHRRRTSLELDVCDGSPRIILEPRMKLDINDGLKRSFDDAGPGFGVSGIESSQGWLSSLSLRLSLSQLDP
jgi:hypothetical protein